MAVTGARIIGRGITAQYGAGPTSITKWSEIALELMSNEEDASASDSTEDEAVFTTNRLNLTVSGFLGSVNTPSTLPARGDAIASLAITETSSTTTVIPSLSGFTNIKVTRTSYDFRKGPATFSWSARNGMLNAPA